MKRSRARAARRAAISAGVLGILLGSAPPAVADHHFMSISEVYPGTMDPADDNEFVELQMYAAGQNNLIGPMHQTHLRIYDDDGTVNQTVDPGSDPPNAQNQQSILFATPGADAEFGPNGDYLMADADDIQPDGGAVCFESDLTLNIDCVAWGNFDNSTAMLPVGVNETAIPLGSSITRSIAPNCPTALDGADDTNDSQTDFSATTPTPRNNAGPITETPCTPPGGTFTPPGNPASPINPAGNVRKRKCKKKPKGASAAKKKCGKKKR